MYALFDLFDSVKSVFHFFIKGSRLSRNKTNKDYCFSTCLLNVRRIRVMSSV